MPDTRTAAVSMALTAAVFRARAQRYELFCFAMIIGLIFA